MADRVTAYLRASWPEPVWALRSESDTSNDEDDQEANERSDTLEQNIGEVAQEVSSSFIVVILVTGWDSIGPAPPPGTVNIGALWSGWGVAPAGGDDVGSFLVVGDGEGAHGGAVPEGFGLALLVVDGVG